MADAIWSSTPAVVGYVLLNVFCSCGVVFASKLVYLNLPFCFVATLTLINTISTWIGMFLVEQLGFYTAASFSPQSLLPLALGFCGYVLLNSLSLSLNSVGVFQVLKIAATPMVVALEAAVSRRLSAGPKGAAALALACGGVGVATGFDASARANLGGVAVGLAAVAATGLYQFWSARKQHELQANSSQLLFAYTPQAILIIAIAAPLVDSYGFREALSAHPLPDTVLGYGYGIRTTSAILLAALLGVLVSLSTFLVLATTSPATYSLLGHAKTVLILAGGCWLFGDSMSWQRGAGVAAAMAGVAAYAFIASQASKPVVAPRRASRETAPLITSHPVDTEP
ncbi:hypothetical protein HYH03_004011 [Edaphochlamys debaryana]|uniref:Sugar phosphate transporter domain-containing protein n=1 Tax=Edaphochlamys debaryana TaxID=47281 RepID=A0A835YCF9_9CHLO|nr:hypothetical protein HYH03_004011 [Edaphochlamys debaryana]|eukprot:KAG2498261.1 hypothetical protein HYH03_004011 [Edaphochlamys debaryana]